MSTPISGSGPERARFLRQAKQARQAEQKKQADRSGDAAAAQAGPPSSQLLEQLKKQDSFEAGLEARPAAPALGTTGPAASGQSFKAAMARPRRRDADAASDAAPAPSDVSRVDDPRIAAQYVAEMRNAFSFQMQRLAQSPGKLGAILAQAYGDTLSPQASAKLVERARQGRFPLPADLRFVGDAELQGRNAAYSPENGGTVYLNKDLVDDPKRMQAAFNEECGHHLGRVSGDSAVRGGAGRVLGEALAKGDVLGPKELAAAREDRDQGTIAVDGVQVPVELQRMSAKALSALDAAKGQLGGRAPTEADVGRAVEALRGLEGKDLRDALGALQQDGALGRMLEALPRETRGELFQRVGKSGDGKAKSILARAVAAEEAGLLGGLKVWDAQTQTAVDKLKRLDPATLGMTLAEMERGGQLTRLFEEMPYPVRADFMRLVRDSHSPRAHEAVTSAVAGHVGDLMSGMPAEGDARLSGALLRDLGPGMLGRALEDLRDGGKLAPLLREMPRQSRAELMKAVRDSGDGQAQALVAKAASDEMDRLRAGEAGWLKHPLLGTSAAPSDPAAGRPDTRLAEELKARQAELKGLLEQNQAEAMARLADVDALVAVQRNLSQPFAEPI
jgi:hypothetical protein